MKFTATDLPGVVLIEPAVFSDDRGWFTESFNRQRFIAGLASLGLPAPREFVQDNESASRRGVLRGLHYQLPPHAQGKLVRVTQGTVFDVAVDLRRSSPSFGRWIGVELSGANHRQFWLPPGCAHGFLVLSASADFLYKTTDYYAPTAERAIRWDDATLAIAWPDAGVPPRLSARDAAAGNLADAITFD